ncbi:c-type cytochrome [Ilyomonas limi]|nr:cytochrome c [Ilyomonas limi]
MMKKLSIILFSIAGVAVATGCSDIRREPGLIYMPDMAYSRAYETYVVRDTNYFTMDSANPHGKIFYNARPVAGTIMRGEDLTFTLPKDKAGDSTYYVASKQIQNPLTNPGAADLKEGERLYLINCAICHGSKLDGNGPLYKGGQGPFPSAPKNLVSDPYTVNMPPGQMYYSITYGKNLMGPYGSQLDHHQRWMVINYIKSKQAANAPKPASTSNTEPANADAGANANTSSTTSAGTSATK